jgi:drug/metabolite transporter (DMT)-like permease
LKDLTSRRQFLPLVLLAGAVLFWGTSFAAVKVALDSFTPMTVMWLRMAVATLVFAPFWTRVKRPEYREGDWRLLAIAAACIPCLYYLAEGNAVLLTTSSQAGVVSAIVPLLVAGGAWLLWRDKLTWQGAVAIGLSLAAIVVLSLSGSAQQSAPNPALGNFLELLAMFAAAGSMLTIKHLSTRYDPWWLTGMQAAVGAVFFLPMALASGPATWLAAPPIAWACVAYLGTFVSLAAFGLYNSALRAIPASRAALSINLVPAVALLAGWLVLAESLNAVQMAACAVAIGAVIFGELGGTDAEPHSGEAVLAARETP